MERRDPSPGKRRSSLGQLTDKLGSADQLAFEMVLSSARVLRDKRQLMDDFVVPIGAFEVREDDLDVA